MRIDHLQSERKKVVDFSPVIFIAGTKLHGEEGIADQVAFVT